MVIMTYFSFEPKIIYMWSLEKFEVIEILCVITFDIICSFNFVLNCVHQNLQTPIFSIANYQVYLQLLLFNPKISYV
jgi:hypothetical protein